MSPALHPKRACCLAAPSSAAAELVGRAPASHFPLLPQKTMLKSVIEKGARSGAVASLTRFKEMVRPPWRMVCVGDLRERPVTTP